MRMRVEEREACAAVAICDGARTGPDILVRRARDSGSREADKNVSNMILSGHDSVFSPMVVALLRCVFGESYEPAPDDQSGLVSTATPLKQTSNTL
jgi:hypothetical protein